MNLIADLKCKNVDTMANHEEKSPDQEGGDIVAHQANISSKRENEPKFDEPRYQMIPCFVLIMDVVDHQHDGYWFQKLQVVDLECFANHLKSSYHKDNQIQNRQ